MKPTAAISFPRSRGGRRLLRAFSLIEVLVVTGLLSVIIIGLVMMFAQTQRAYKLGTTQVDVLESGRMATDLLTRDLQQCAASGQPDWINFLCNFYVGTPNFDPLTQELPGSTARRTNLMQETFFLTRENQTWTAVGYFVRTNDQSYLAYPAGSGGSLYRFETNYSDTVFRQNPQWPWRDFTAALTNANRASRVLEGVVHFKLRTYTSGGDRIRTNYAPVALYPNVHLQPPAGAPVAFYPFGETPYLYFFSNAIPASVEIELGVLEAREIERARAISSPTARATYLSQQAGKVHLFRWRVPVRNADSSVYQ